MGAVPEAQINAFIDKVAGPSGPGPIEEILIEADALAQVDDVPGAAALYSEVLEHEPENLRAIAALAKLQLDLGELEAAKHFLAMAPAEKAADPALASVRAAIELAEQAASLGDHAELEAKVASNPADHQSRFDLALALAAQGDRDAATDHLVEIIKRDRTWNDDGARKQLLQFFEAWGATIATMAGRRKLSTVLFR